MHSASAAPWEPEQLGSYLEAQLCAHGHAEAAASTCAAQLLRVSGPAATASLLVDLGACHFLSGDLAGAIATWRQVISSKQPAAASRALFNLGLLYEGLGRYAQSIAVLQSATQHLVEPYQSSSSMVIARCQAAAGDTAAAMQTLAELTHNLLAVRPEPALLGQALLALGDAAAGAGRQDRADRAWRAAAVSGSSSIRSLVDARLATSDVVESVDSASPVAPEAPEPDTLDRVDELGAAGRRREAIDLLVSVPGASLAAVDRFRFAEMLVAHGLVNQAIDQLEVLLSAPVDEHQMRAGFMLGELYRSHLMLPDAETMYLRVVNGDDEIWSTRALVGLAEVLEEIGEASQAMLYWERAAMCSDPSVRSAAEERLATGLGVAATPAPIDPTPTGTLHAVGSVGVGEAVIDVGSVGVGEVVIDVGSVGVGEVVIDVGSVGVGEAVIDVVEDEPMIDLATSAEPVIVLLASAPDDADTTELAAPPQVASPSVAVKPRRPVVVSLRESAAAGCVIEFDQTSTAPRADTDTASMPAHSIRRTDASPSNPYAALAPDDLDDSVMPSNRNPYAELAPNYDQPEPDVGEVTEPSHWRSMLDEWPVDSRSGFFARK